MQNEQSNSKLKNLVLTASIVSLFVTNPHQTQAQSLDKTKGMENKEYFKDHMMLFNLPQKDVNVEFPGRDKYFLSLLNLACS